MFSLGLDHQGAAAPINIRKPAREWRRQIKRQKSPLRHGYFYILDYANMQTMKKRLHAEMRKPA
jgi:hypothetical protein